MYLQQRWKQRLAQLSCMRCEPCVDTLTLEQWRGVAGVMCHSRQFLFIEEAACAHTLMLFYAPCRGCQPEQRLTFTRRTA